jgi:Rps23 Pro-64 3,4-dihydroxylase Tpa1-like proline 4-hydroxylase
MVLTEDFALNPALDPESLSREFSRRRRIHIPSFLHKRSAERLLAHLRERQDWRLVFNQGDRLFELDRTAQAALTPQMAADLDTGIYKSARQGFQFRYETVRVPDSEGERCEDGSLLAQFARFLSSPDCLDFFRRVTGQSSIGFADAQATAYGPNHFLTSHDDEVAGKNRLAAYVFSLASEWRADWGGLLTFTDRSGWVEESFVPRFNTLNIFAVPQPHSVSFVAPFVPYRRYSVTGWLREKPPALPGSRSS